MALIRFKRGTRAELDAAATANELNSGEPYYITDEDGYAIGSGPGSYVDFNVGNWDAAFGWGDHSVEDYGRRDAANTWTDTNVFFHSFLYVSDFSFNQGTFLAPDLSSSPEWTLPNASGTLALTDDIPSPGGTANQLQVNDGSGGLAGIPVTYSNSRFSELPVNAGATFNIVRSDGNSVAQHTYKVEATGATTGLVWHRFGRDTNTSGDVLITYHNHDGSAGQWWNISKANGMTLGSPTGGFPGAGKINAEGVQVDGNDVWHSGNLEYDTETVTLGGDFDPGQQVKCVRVGDQVTITSLGVLSHRPQSLAAVAFGAIPAKYRPSHNTSEVYFVDFNDQVAKSVAITTEGSLQIVINQDSSGGDTAYTDTSTAFTTTYNV